MWEHGGLRLLPLVSSARCSPQYTYDTSKNESRKTFLHHCSVSTPRFEVAGLMIQLYGYLRIVC